MVEDRRSEDGGGGAVDEGPRLDEDARAKIARALALTTLGVVGAAAVAATSKRPAEAPADQATRSAKAAVAGSDAVIQTEWDLPAVKNDRVDFFIEYLTTQKRDEMKLWLERLGYFGPMLRAELAARDMPQDLVYLAMIESGFDPRAYSRADASGLWQFIEETGERYGLRVNEWVDERNDPVQATGAALDYLSEMHDDFGSWFLAAAGYNTGENRVRRVLDQHAGGARGDEDLYWQIDAHLPRETRDYVPLMLAAAHIAKDPAKYGFTDLRFQSPMEYEEVRVPGRTPLSRVAEAAGVDMGSIEQLNPHFKKGTTPPAAGTVRVPAGTQRAVAANLASSATSADDMRRAD